jgi:hypoxanthine phosphoribosyltransferase
MVIKEFVTYDSIRNNAIRLAHRIHKEGFNPDVIYVSLRGGAYLGNVISEYFKIVHKGKRPVFYAAVVAHSYVDIQKHEQVRVDGWTYNPDYLRTGDRILLVDDIYDSGRTINHLAGIIMARGVPRSDIRIAVHDYKIREYGPEPLAIVPDYWCRMIRVKDPSDENWVHYMSHELAGLSREEAQTHYLAQDALLAEALDDVLI